MYGVYSCIYILKSLYFFFLPAFFLFRSFLTSPPSQLRPRTPLYCSLVRADAGVLRNPHVYFCNAAVAFTAGISQLLIVPRTAQEIIVPVAHVISKIVHLFWFQEDADCERVYRCVTPLLSKKVRERVFPSGQQ